MRPNFSRPATTSVLDQSGPAHLLPGAHVIHSNGQTLGPPGRTYAGPITSRTPPRRHQLRLVDRGGGLLVAQSTSHLATGRVSGRFPRRFGPHDSCVAGVVAASLEKPAALTHHAS